jgi:hypothetical protein
MFELILRAPRSKQVLVYSRFYISQNLLYSQFFFHMVRFCGFYTIERNVNGEFEVKSERLKVSIQNSYWEQTSLFALFPLLSPIAQLVEHLASKQEVVCSSLRWSKITFLCPFMYYHNPLCNSLLNTILGSRKKIVLAEFRFKQVEGNQLLHEAKCVLKVS